VNAAELLPLVRELFSRDHEYRDRESWELQWLLFSLRYTDELEDEAEVPLAQRHAGHIIEKLQERAA
jgi:hypothetical protein